ncbi:MAG: glycoside hydrolase family 1 protein [Kineosporiaceae bacterium]|nr:glycoside hydrolase family 1 protein [Kineosporiaceae bacterium]
MESTAGDRSGESRRRQEWWAAQASEVDPRSLHLPAGFRWGVATSAHQVEGGTTANTWSAWELTRRPDGSPAIARGQRCGPAANHWELLATDLGLMRWLGVDLYRFSVEWSRVEPLPGHIDHAALDRYRAWCQALIGAGITPMVTLHHFTEPQWASEHGGFAYAGTVDAWLRFVHLCLDRFGDLVGDWVTINEPVAYVVQGWVRGVWPPGLQEPATAVSVLENLLLAHARAYHAIHERDGQRRHRVGLAHHLMPLQAARGWNPADVLLARFADAGYNRAVPEALRTGVLRLRLPGIRYAARLHRLRGTQDFFGVNHSHRALVVARLGADPSLDLRPRPSKRHDLGSVLRWARRYGLPIVVTEHTTEHTTIDGHTADDQRRRVLGSGLAELAAAVRDGADVRAYVHWSLIDTFEWTHGYDVGTGLFRVDRGDFHRTATGSAGYYREVIAAHRAGEAPVDRA